MTVALRVVLCVLVYVESFGAGVLERAGVLGVRTAIS